MGQPSLAPAVWGDPHQEPPTKPHHKRSAETPLVCAISNRNNHTYIRPLEDALCLP